jgi:hypothetical protein
MYRYCSYTLQVDDASDFPLVRMLVDIGSENVTEMLHFKFCL